MKRYQLTLRGDLLFTRAALRKDRFLRVTTLLIDTGASYTIVSWETLTSLGIDPASSQTRRALMTANGLIQAPEVKVDDFYCFGHHVPDFPLVAHSIPLGATVDGVLGMNFLRQYTAKLSLKEGVVEV